MRGGAGGALRVEVEVGGGVEPPQSQKHPDQVWHFNDAIKSRRSRRVQTNALKPIKASCGEMTQRKVELMMTMGLR